MKEDAHMNKTTKVFLILGLTLLLTGLLLGGVGLVSASGQLRDGLGEELLSGLTVGERLELRFEREFAGEVRALEVDSGVANLRLLESRTAAVIWWRRACGRMRWKPGWRTAR